MRPAGIGIHINKFFLCHRLASISYDSLSGLGFQQKSQQPLPFGRGCCLGKMYERNRIEAGPALRAGRALVVAADELREAHGEDDAQHYDHDADGGGGGGGQIGAGPCEYQGAKNYIDDQRNQGFNLEHTIVVFHF
jgi:hypothetical protein